MSIRAWGSGMGRKNKNAIESSAIKGKHNKRPFTFLNFQFDNINKTIVKRHIFLLILASIVTNILVIVFTTSVFHSFIDLFDFQYYIEHMISVMSGKIPYVDFSFDYPPLAFLPILLAFIPAFLLNNFFAFVYSFQILMVICNLITTVCIYLIGLKLYNSRTAFFAAVLYATAFSATYFVLTKYDAFPTCLLMVAVLFTLYSMNIRGYLAIVFGVIAKIFPGISLPFLLLYNAKTTSFKQELYSVLKIFVPLVVIILVPIILFKPGVLFSYISVSLVRSDVYASTATYTLYAYLHDVFNLGISATIVSNLMYFVMGGVLLFLVVIAWLDPKKEPRHLLKFLLLSIFTVVFCMKYHSPQYIVWFTPFVCLLIADTLSGVILFYVTQILTYLEFPLLFGTLYDNGKYLSPPGSYGWYLALFFFTLEYAAYLILMYLAVKPSMTHLKKFRSNFKAAIRKRE